MESGRKERYVMILDLSLQNRRLYAGCRVRGKHSHLHLETPPDQASAIIETNLRHILEEVPDDDGGEIVLTGRIPTWVYLVVYEAARERFDRVSQHDGRRKISIKPRP